jgi:hypothetical protein
MKIIAVRTSTIICCYFVGNEPRNVKLSHSMKMYVEREVKFHTSLTSEIAAGERSALCLGRIYAGKGVADGRLGGRPQAVWTQ